MHHYPGEFAVHNVLSLFADAVFLFILGSCESPDTARSALPYLNEDYIIPIGHDQVDLTEEGIVIAFQQREALLFPPATGGSFLPVAFSRWGTISGLAEAGPAGSLAAGEPVSLRVTGTTLAVVGSYQSR